MEPKEIARMLKLNKRNDMFSYEEGIVPSLRNETGLSDKDIIYYLYMALDDFKIEIQRSKVTEEDIHECNQQLMDEKKDLENKNLLLAAKVANLQKDLKICKKALQSFNGHDVQRELLHNGKAIAYRDDIDEARVKELLDQGNHVSEVAKRLGVSRGLVYRRIKKLKEMEQQQKENEKA